MGDDKIFLATRNGLLHLNEKGNFFGQWEGGSVRGVTAGSDDLFYVTNSDQVKAFRTFSYGGRKNIDAIPLGGGTIAAGTLGGFYLGGITTERGVWLVKFAPPTLPVD